MTDPVFLGITKAEWELVNSFANWISAIGTLAAVVLSLWLATRSWRPRARVRVGHRVVIDSGDIGPWPEVIVFSVVNTGEKPLRITGIGWSIGFFRWKRQAIQMHDRVQSSPIPVELTHGQEATWLFPLLPGEEGWMQSFPQKMLLPHWRLGCLTLRGVFSTSIGKTFVAKVEPGLLKRIREQCERLQ